MGWYKNTKRDVREICALRKHNLNVDLHIHALEDPNTEGDAPAQLQTRFLNTICGAAILKGLDLIGIVSPESYEPGHICQQVITQNQYDLITLAGVEIKSAEGTPTIVYNAETIPRDGEAIEDVCSRAHAEGGVVMVVQPNKDNMNRLNKIAGEPNAPDFIEMFNDMAQSGYVHFFKDLEPAQEFELVVNSAARSPQELDQSVMVSRVSRKKLMDMGLVGEEQGTNYVPPYLEKVHGQHGQGQHGQGQGGQRPEQRYPIP